MDSSVEVWVEGGAGAGAGAGGGGGREASSYTVEMVMWHIT